MNRGAAHGLGPVRVKPAWPLGDRSSVDVSREWAFPCFRFGNGPCMLGPLPQVWYRYRLDSNVSLGGHRFAVHILGVKRDGVNEVIRYPGPRFGL